MFSGSFRWKLTVSDGESSDTDDVWITVIENLAPVADAGGNQSVALAESILLDGSASSDPDGDALTYLWTFESVPEGSELNDTSIKAATAAIAAFQADVEGSYMVTLEVSDGNFVVTDTVEITVGGSGCGCASTPEKGGVAAWGGLLLGLLAFRRRERTQ